MTLDGLPWVPEELAGGLLRIVHFLQEALGPAVSRIGLYGSWQRGDATQSSDVDIVVVLDGEVPWFDATRGVICPSGARRDRARWRAIAREANTRRLDSRTYSIVVLTPAMLGYYASRGPIHLQNWAYAVTNSHPLWEGSGRSTQL